LCSFVAAFLAAATSLFAVDELALRLEPALEAITPDGMLAHIKVLASDEFEGRAHRGRKEKSFRSNISAISSNRSG
jgi:hypothetical protein